MPLRVALGDSSDQNCQQATITFTVRSQGFIPIQDAPLSEFNSGDELVLIFDQMRDSPASDTTVEFRVKKFDGSEEPSFTIELTDLFRVVRKLPQHEGRIFLDNEEAH